MKILYAIIFVSLSLLVGASTFSNLKKVGNGEYKTQGLSKAGFLGREFSKMILGIATAYMSVLLLDLAIDGIKTLLLRWFLWGIRDWLL